MKKLSILTIILTFFATVAYAGSEKKQEKGKNSQIIMKAFIFSFLIIFYLLVPAFAADSKGNNMEKLQSLSQRQQNIIPIAAFTADGNIARLKPALNQGLDDGLTVNEIKEVLVHLYAYAGFPRSLNALSAFMGVVDERKAKGIEDVQGKEASPVPSDLNKDEYGAKVRAMLAGRETDISGARWQQFSPAIDTFLKEHLFADIFVRDVISHQDRELATIAALANMTGTEGQLGFHLGAAMNTGLTEAQMKGFISVLETTVGKAQAESAQKILNEVLSNRK
jgi:4-carboxymuconolactone decarboxylase